MLTLDTRFFLTHFLADSDGLKHKTRAKILEAEREASVVPTIVIHELYKYEYEKLGRDVADLRIRSILGSTFNVVELTSQIAILAASLRCKYRMLPTADSIIAATAIETKSMRVLSDDPHFWKIKEIKTEWIE